MNIKKKLIMATVAFALLSLTSLARAEVVRLPLMAAKPHKGAAGTVYLSNDRIRLEATGLRPEAVYTLWFVNMKPKKHVAGVGIPPYAFTTDARGNGTYEASLSESPFGRWQSLMIMLHPTGDPKDMKHMVAALSTRIPAGGDTKPRGRFESEGEDY